eukprot:Rmarinus@m.17642
MLSRSCEIFTQAWWAGVKDALNIWRTLIFFIKSPRLRTHTFQCFLLNGIIFLGSLFLIEHILKPLVHHLLSMSSNESEEWNTAASWIQTFLDLSYSIMWLAPVYALSFILNTLWYNEIADEAFRLHYPKLRPRPNVKFSAVLADEIYRLLLVGVYFLQLMIVGAMPYIGTFAGIVMFSWLNALYCFEYKWANQSWTLTRRCDYFEKHWIYFLGFGTPCTIATYFFPTFLSGGIWALLFPFLIITAVVSRPVNHHAKQSILPNRLPIFALAISVCSMFLSTYMVPDN